MFTGLVAGLAGGALGVASSIGGALLNNYHSAQEARAADERAFAQWWNMTEYGPSLQRKALKKAGYNPMLALGQSTPSMPSAHQGTTSAPDIAGSAASMGRFVREAVKDKLSAEINNVEADTALKNAQISESETRRLQNEASTSLINSQTDRTDLAYGRDIASTAADIANVGIAAHNAKTLGQLRGGKQTKSGAKPKVKRSAPVAPNKVAPFISHSAKSAAAAAATLGLPAAAGAGLGLLEGKNKAREIKSGEHWNPKDKTNRKEKARKKWYLYHDIGF